MPSSSATYVYCIVSSRQPLSTTHTPAGPPGTRGVRALEVRPQRYAVISDAPLDDFSEQPLARHLSDLDWVSRAAVAHEAVIASFMPQSDAVVPMKLFTLFTNDARALEQLRSGWTRVERLIRRLAKHDEWGLRLVFDDTRAPADDQPAGIDSGRNYLLAKRRQQAAATARKTNMRKVAGDVLKSLRPLTRDTRQRAITGPQESRSRLLLDAAFLVPRGKAARFRTAAARQAKKIAPAGFALQVTGPWPPYSFVDTA
jgi:Gas vesicle synthesis protein GvpL/GvpF